MGSAFSMAKPPNRQLSTFEQKRPGLQILSPVFYPAFSLRPALPNLLAEIYEDLSATWSGIRITPPNTDTVHRTRRTAHQTCASSTQPQRWHLPRNHRANAIVDVIAQYTAAVDCLMLDAIPSSMLHGDRPLPDQVLSRRISAQISALTFSVSE